MIEQASLVIGEGNWAVKSDSLLGYKINGGKYYPREMSVVRATTGTRINEDGLVELVPYNLLTYSNTFTTNWTLLNATLTSGQSGYDSSADAWKLQSTGSNNSQIDQAFTQSGTQTFSIYAKKGTANYLVISVFNGGFGWYNLNNGTLGTSGGTFVSRDIISVGNGWYRCTIVTSVAISGAAVYVADADGSTNAANGSNIFIQNSQLVEGSSALDYLPTTDRLDVARIDYSSGSGALLVEPQRTNLALWSSSFDNAAYSSGGTGSITVTANYATAPDGTTSADRIQITRGSTYQEFFQRPATTIGQTYTLSFWAKSLSGTPTLYTAFNNGYINEVTFTNEWVRYEYTYAAASASSGFNLVTWSSLPSTSTSADILLWGYQLELGNYQTSYIPTQAATVTRNADVISKTGIADLIGQTEGTIFWYVKKNLGENDTRLNISDGTTNNWLFVGIEFDNRPRIYCNVGGVNQFNIYGTQVSNDFHKIAFAYKANDFALYIDGVQALTHSSGSVPTCSRLDLAIAIPTLAAFTTALTNAAALWKTRLTNAQLATLTTI